MSVRILILMLPTTPRGCVPFEIIDEDSYEKDVIAHYKRKLDREAHDLIASKIAKCEQNISRCEEEIQSTKDVRLNTKLIGKKNKLLEQRKTLLNLLPREEDGDNEFIKDQDDSSAFYNNNSTCVEEELIHAGNDSIVNSILSEEVDSPELLGTDQILDDLDDADFAERIIKSRSDRLFSKEDLHIESTSWSIPGTLAEKLLPYQLEGICLFTMIGVKWLLGRFQVGSGGILADEMGLGKTLQVIAAISSVLTSESGCKKGVGSCALVITPATIVPQWVNEFHRWYPPIRVIALHRSVSELWNKKSRKKIFSHDHAVYITSYATALQHKRILLSSPWKIICLDEGHKIRNPDAEIAIALRTVPTSNRILLSGTPIQNSLKDLWSLVDWVHPGLLGSLHTFGIAFETPIKLGSYAHAGPLQSATAYRCAMLLKDMVEPVLLRRWKNQVATQLPSKTEQIVFCRLSKEQRDLYTKFLQDSPMVASIRAGRHNLLHGIDIMRKICNAPQLLLHSLTHQQMHDQPNNFPWLTSDQISSLVSITIGKFVILDSILREWANNMHRALVFCQTRQMLDVIEKFVVQMGYTYLRMDGATDPTQRLPLINTFNASKSIFLFLLTTRVGGLGLNLTGADRVVIYDPDWNPSTDVQARERVWRLGQQKSVQIYRLITKGTIEEKIYRRQIFKTIVTNRILRDPRKLRLFKRAELHDLFTLDDEEAKSPKENEEDVFNRESETNSILSMLTSVGNDVQGLPPIESQKPFVQKEAEKLASNSLRLLQASKQDDPIAGMICSFFSARGGSATTEAILEHFKEKISPKDKNKFKSKLLQLADKNLIRGEVIWSLKE